MDQNEGHTLSDCLVASMKCGDVDEVRRLLVLHPDLVHGPGWVPPPLHCAVLWDQPEVIDAFLEAGADIEQKDPDQNTTPLRYAILYVRPNAVERLMERGAETGAVTEDGTTALELAEEAAGGAFEEFDDLPKREAYAEVVELLKAKIR